MFKKLLPLPTHYKFTTLSQLCLTSWYTSCLSAPLPPDVVTRHQGLMSLYLAEAVIGPELLTLGFNCRDEFEEGSHEQVCQNYVKQAIKRYATASHREAVERGLKAGVSITELVGVPDLIRTIEREGTIFGEPVDVAALMTHFVADIESNAASPEAICEAIIPGHMNSFQELTELFGYSFLTQLSFVLTLDTLGVVELDPDINMYPNWTCFKAAMPEFLTDLINTPEACNIFLNAYGKPGVDYFILYPNLVGALTLFSHGKGEWSKDYLYGLVEMAESQGSQALIQAIQAMPNQVCSSVELALREVSICLDSEEWTNEDLAQLYERCFDGSLEFDEVLSHLYSHVRSSFGAGYKLNASGSLYISVLATTSIPQELLAATVLESLEISVALALEEENPSYVTQIGNCFPTEGETIVGGALENVIGAILDENVETFHMQLDRLKAYLPVEQLVLTAMLDRDMTPFLEQTFVARLSKPHILKCKNFRQNLFNWSIEYENPHTAARILTELVRTQDTQDFLRNLDDLLAHAYHGEVERLKRLFSASMNLLLRNLNALSPSILKSKCEKRLFNYYIQPLRETQNVSLTFAEYMKQKVPEPAQGLMVRQFGIVQLASEKFTGNCALITVFKTMERLRLLDVESREEQKFMSGCTTLINAIRGNNMASLGPDFVMPEVFFVDLYYASLLMQALAAVEGRSEFLIAYIQHWNDRVKRPTEAECHFMTTCMDLVSEGRDLGLKLVASAQSLRFIDGRRDFEDCLQALIACKDGLDDLLVPFCFAITLVLKEKQTKKEFYLGACIGALMIKFNSKLESDITDKLRRFGFSTVQIHSLMCGTKIIRELLDGCPLLPLLEAGDFELDRFFLGTINAIQAITWPVNNGKSVLIEVNEAINEFSDAMLPFGYKPGKMHTLDVLYHAKVLINAKVEAAKP